MVGPVPKVTPEEYLELERRAEFKSEYWHGEIFAMIGVSISHSTIQGNLIRHAGNRLAQSKCVVHGSDLKVGVHRGKHGFAYPDASILCGKPEFVDPHRDVVTNPVVIFEVLSPGTENDDRGRKFVEYRKLSSFRHYVLISQDQVPVEYWAKQEDGAWLLRELKTGDTLRLPDLRLEIPIDALYENVELLPTSEDAPA